MVAKPARLPSPSCLQKAAALIERPLRTSLSLEPGGVDGTGSQGKREDGSSPEMKYNEACPVPRAADTRVTPYRKPYPSTTLAHPSFPTEVSPIPVGATTKNPTLLRKEGLPCP